MASKKAKAEPKITKVSYLRVINLGNFETVRIGWEAEVGEKDCPDEVLEQLRDKGLREERKARGQRF